MKVFDCFPFFNELELLELRLAELYDTVDYFVLVEANKTHTGKDKPFYFEKNKDRYKQYQYKIIPIKVGDCPIFSPSRFAEIETFHRNAITRGLEGVAVEGDKILISDLDEIPKPSSITDNLDYPNWMYLQHDLFCYYVNCQVQRSCGGTVMANYGTYRDPQQLRNFAKRRYWYTGGTIENIIVHAGWHYTYLAGGDPKRIRSKVESISDPNAITNLLGTDEEIKKKMLIHIDPYGRVHRWGSQQAIVDISETKPKSMDKFLEKYPQFLFKEKI